MRSGWRRSRLRGSGRDIHGSGIGVTRYRSGMLAAGIAVSAVLLWVALRGVEFAEFREAMAGADWWLLLPLLAGLLAFYWARTWRWKLLLDPLGGTSTRGLFGAVMIGYGANFVLPFQFGEVARSFAARSRTGLPFMSLAFSIVVERIFDFTVILLALALALLLHPAMPDYLASFGYLVAAGVAVLITGTFLFSRYTEASIALIEKLLGFLPERPRGRLLHQLRLGASGLSAIHSLRVVLYALAATLLQWLILLACVAVSLQAVGAAVALPTALLALALIVLGSSVPNAPGYVGSIQAGYVVALQAAGGDPADGFAASLVFHAMYAASAILLGAVALRRSRLGVRELRSRMAENPDAGPVSASGDDLPPDRLSP